MDTAPFVLLLQEIPGLGEKALATILRRNAVLRRSPEEFLRLPGAQMVGEYGLRREVVRHLSVLEPGRLAESEAAARFLRRAGVTLLTLLDATYPPRLLQRLENPPPILFAYGDRTLLSHPLFAVANSNGASEAALSACDAAASAALECGWFPVTGHNRPPYQRPALVARRRGGRVCYVLDRGLLEAFGGDLSRQLFPAARIWSPTYDPTRDLTLSPFGLHDHGIAANNRRRDTLLFALADAIFAGEVRPGGQMERVCRAALGRGTPVFLAGPESAAGPALLAAGARRVGDEGDRRWESVHTALKNAATSR